MEKSSVSHWRCGFCSNRRESQLLSNYWNGATSNGQRILNLEQSDPCEDLPDFVHDNTGRLKECDPKFPQTELQIIMEQLVDALIQIHAHVFFFIET
ncbi:uncharacterized protein V6R79_006624 [Siganus canaliculatus]